MQWASLTIQSLPCKCICVCLHLYTLFVLFVLFVRAWWVIGWLAHWVVAASTIVCVIFTMCTSALWRRRHHSESWYLICVCCLLMVHRHFVCDKTNPMRCPEFILIKNWMDWMDFITNQKTSSGVHAHNHNQKTPIRGDLWCHDYTPPIRRGATLQLIVIIVMIDFVSWWNYMELIASIFINLE